MNSKVVCVCYVGDRKTGKTTILQRICKEALNEKRFLVVVDSVLEHPRKSLVKKLQQIGTGGKLINWINLSSALTKIKNSQRPLFFDVSFFAERSHDLVVKPFKALARFLYRLQIAQILFFLFHRLSRSKIPTTIILDEPDLSKLAKKQIRRLSRLPGIRIAIALHNEDEIDQSSPVETIYLKHRFK